MFRLVSSLFKYILWLASVVLLLDYTKEHNFIERCIILTAAVVIIDAVFLLIEAVYNAVRSTKRAGAKVKQRAHERSIARAEKRGARKAQKEARAKQPEPGLLERLRTYINNPESDGQ